LSAANSAALNAASTFAALTPTQSVPSGAISGTTTVSAANPGGLNVLNVTGINLGNGQTLTLSGSAGSQFVVNDSGGLTLNSGAIALSGGVTADDVVFNMINGGAVSTSGGLNNESVLNGLVLDATGKIQLTPGLVNGEIVGGDNINLASGATINNTPTPAVAPAPPSLVLMSLGGLAFIGLTVLSRRRGTAPALQP
ncbi:MAG TPA: choice-of-anchor A family protein, partial [Gemmataceae bacterium]|nr:choice-of-anchor A family protein [Gemmataceae bacterium]